jgi:hypothetical protein
VDHTPRSTGRRAAQLLDQPLPASIACVALAGCTDSPGTTSTPDASTERTASSTVVRFDQALHEELVALAHRDQTGRSAETAEERIERLKEIIDELGWPTFEQGGHQHDPRALVGKKGEDAAWLIAQHADLDPQFQQWVWTADVLRQAWSRCPTTSTR